MPWVAASFPGTIHPPRTATPIQATPFFATEYTFAHMGLQPKHHQNITMKGYEAGHMICTSVPSLMKLKADVDQFIDSALPANAAKIVVSQ